MLILGSSPWRYAGFLVSSPWRYAGFLGSSPWRYAGFLGSNPFIVGKLDLWLRDLRFLTGLVVELKSLRAQYLGGDDRYCRAYQYCGYIYASWNFFLQVKLYFHILQCSRSRKGSSPQNQAFQLSKYIYPQHQGTGCYPQNQAFLNEPTTGCYP